MKKNLKEQKNLVVERTEMPLLLTRNVIVFPGCELRIDVGRAHSLISISSGKKKFDSKIVVVSQENPSEEKPTLKKISRFGTLCSFEIREESEKGVKEEQKVYSLFVKGIKRVKLSKLSFKNNYSATITDYPTDFKLKDRNKVLYGKINFLLINNLDNIFRYYGVLENRLSELRDHLESRDLEKVIFLLANYLPFFSFEKKKEILEAKKIETMYQILFGDLKKLAAREKKQTTEKGYSGHQKIIDKFLKQLNSNPYPEEMKKVIYEEIRNYGMLPPTSSESHVIRSYIETVFSLP
jgi:ATP-dependent Lon protease